MTPETSQLLKAIAYLGLMLGLLGTVAPVLPGPWLVFASAVLWAWADGFLHVGWPTLAAMGVLAVLATVSNVVIGTYGSRRGGAAWSSIVVSAVAGVVGFLLFNLPGALVGSLGGLVVVEWRRHGGDWAKAWRSSRGMVLGWILSTVVEVGLVLLMLLLFTLQAFGPA